MRLSPFFFYVAAMMLFCVIEVKSQETEPAPGSVNIFGVRSENPKVSKGKSNKNKLVSKKIKAAKKNNKNDLSEKVDAALSEGNSARDANPPRYEDAERAYQKAITLVPKDSRAYLGLGNIYFDQKRYDEAEKAYRRAIELNPSDALAHVNLANTLNKSALNKSGLNDLGPFKEAANAAQQAVELAPRDYRGHETLGWSKYYLKSYDEAESSFRLATALAPRERNPYIGLQRLLLVQRRYREAAPLQKKIAELAPNVLEGATSLVAYGRTLLKIGELDHSAEQFLYALQLSREVEKMDSRAFSYITNVSRSKLGLIYYTQGDEMKARQYWNDAVAIGNDSIARAGLLILDRNFNEALKQMEYIYTKMRGEQEDLLLLLGDARRLSGDREGASRAYVEAASLAPDYARLRRPNYSVETGGLARIDTSNVEPNNSSKGLGQLVISSVEGVLIDVVTLEGKIVVSERVPISKGLSVNLRPGQYKVTGRQRGYYAFTKDVEIKEGETIAIDLQLRLLSRPTLKRNPN